MLFQEEVIITLDRIDLILQPHVHEGFGVLVQLGSLDSVENVTVAVDVTVNCPKKVEIQIKYALIFKVRVNQTY